jgi:hypothetical protein
LVQERTRRVTPAIPFLRKNQCDFPCNIVPGYATLPFMKGKDTLIPELTRVASSMMQGSLSQIARRCGDPACACFRDPARRHGPHLYWNFRHQGRLVSVYVPAEQTAAVRQAHAAWLRFLELGTQISARNRQPFLQQLQREKNKKKKAPSARPGREAKP